MGGGEDRWRKESIRLQQATGRTFKLARGSNVASELQHLVAGTSQALKYLSEQGDAPNTTRLADRTSCKIHINK